MSERPTIRLQGENVGVSDLGAAVFLDPVGEVVNVAACVSVERIQKYDPITGESDRRVWFRRVFWAGQDDQAQPLWEIQACQVYSFYLADAPACSQQEFDQLMELHGVPIDDAEEDRKMDLMHSAIEQVIDELQPNLESDHMLEDWRQRAQDTLLGMAHKVQGLA